jgi:hypothetical protein
LGASSAGARHLAEDVALEPPSVILLAASTPAVFLVVSASPQEFLVIPSTPLLFFIVAALAQEFLVVALPPEDLFVPATPLSLAHGCQLSRAEAVRTPRFRVYRIEKAAWLEHRALLTRNV